MTRSADNDGAAPEVSTERAPAEGHAIAAAGRSVGGGEGSLGGGALAMRSRSRADSRQKLKPCLVIAGPPGSGKSTVGPLLAEHLGVAFRDTDDDIVARAGRSIADIFTTDGEPAFRALEEEVIAAALAEHEGVLSVGGGAVLASGTRERLRAHTVIFLNVGFAKGVQRVGLSTARPLLAGVNPRATYKALLEGRLPVYREVATIEVVTDERSPQDVVAALVPELHRKLEKTQ